MCIRDRSNDLTNSLHVDPFDSSYSYALFYPENVKKKNHKNNAPSTLFSFPYYGIGILIDQPVLISWRGNMMHHCSCTTSPGIYSLFASSNMKVRSLKFVQDLFFKSDSDSIQHAIGQKIHVRLHPSVLLLVDQKSMNATMLKCHCNDEINANLTCRLARVRSFTERHNVKYVEAELLSKRNVTCTPPHKYMASFNDLFV